MGRPIDRYSRTAEGCTGTKNVADVFGTRVADTISASGLASREQAGHLIASDRVGRMFRT